jgi:hypothetical protein
VNRFQFVADHQARYGVKRLCTVLCFCSAGFTALPALSQLAQSGDTEQRDRALDLCGRGQRSWCRLDAVLVVDRGLLSELRMAWTAVRDERGDSGVIVGELLDRLGQEPDAALWRELDSRLVVEAECLDLAAVITRTLHRNHEDDRLLF